MAPLPRQLLTDPAEAADFVLPKPKVDRPAIAIRRTTNAALQNHPQPTGEMLAISRIARFTKSHPQPPNLVSTLQARFPRNADMINQFVRHPENLWRARGGKSRTASANVCARFHIDTDNARPSPPPS